VSIWELLQTATAAEEQAMGKKVLEFRKLIEDLSLSRADKTLYEFGLEVAGRSGILPLYRLNPSPESESALQNIEELLNSMQDYRHRMIEIGAQEEVSEPSLEEWLQMWQHCLHNRNRNAEGLAAWILTFRRMNNI
jgi:DNA helicase-2/ATP-dependent DNA helicase PcrA